MRKLRVLSCTLLMLLAVSFASCSSTQKITVKQEQEGQTQETVIESDTKVNSFAIVISGDRIEYNGSVYRPKAKRGGSAGVLQAPARDMTSDANLRQGCRG